MAANDANNFYVFIDDIEFSSCIPSVSSIGNFVWNDINGNGIQEATELGIAGAIVKLTKTGGVTVSTTTNSNGVYTFSNLSAGTYVVNFITPLGFVPSAAKQGSNVAIDSDPINSVVSVTLADNQNISTIDAGFTAHTYCKNTCTHSCNHNNCGVNHSSCRNNCSHTTCSHSNCGKHTTCRNTCNHTNCGHSNCGTNNNSSSRAAVGTTMVTFTTTTQEKEMSIAPIIYYQLDVKVMPNPSEHEFTLELHGKDKQPITVRLIDMNGKLINTFNNLQSNRTVRFGNDLKKGAYFAEVVQGEERKVIKLIKL
jgi:hypothetical protein